MGLIETLFAENVVRMGPSRHDPSRIVATLNPDIRATLASARTTQLATFQWLLGDWRWENPVPATALSPAYCDAGACTFALSDDHSWICLAAPNGRLQPMITFDPFSRRWMYVLTSGSYGILRSDGWSGNRLVFTGLMTMIGVECEWRMTWTKESDEAFGFVNEEQRPDGSWSYIDEWRYTKTAASVAQSGPGEFRI